MNSSTNHPLPENELFRIFRAAFEKLTGLPLDVIAPGAFEIPDEAPDFCRIMGLATSTCQACCDAHSALQAPDHRGSRTAECFAGMTSSSVPVKVRGKTLAYLQTGHVFLSGGSARNWNRIKRFIERQGLDPDACEAALNAVRTTDPEHYKSAIHLLELFAKQLSETLPEGRFGEGYPAVEKALRLLRGDLEQDWTLTRMAGAVKMNASYFSDVFRRSTGETFSACLARLRVERACRLLESSRLGIGEIGFASGFRSISQFNRTFKRIAGCPPNRFREDRRTLTLNGPAPRPAT